MEIRDFAKFGIDTHGRYAGKMKTYCNKCHSTRKNKRDKSLYVNLDTGWCHCFNCGANFYVPTVREETQKEEAKYDHAANKVPQHFQRPVFDPSNLTLSEEVERYLVEKRCISQKTIAEMKITEQTTVMPQSGKPERCICFNYFENGELVNTKFRTLDKKFKSVTGAESIPYNIDAVRDTDCVIVDEGELDSLSFHTIGIPFAISVPNGAKAGLSVFDRFKETHFDNKKTIIIAVDNDEPGEVLRKALVEYFGAYRCKIMSYGEGCKDANDHLQRYGASSLRVMLEQAKEIPLEDVVTANELEGELDVLFRNGIQCGARTGWVNFDDVCTFELNRVAVVTGIPGSGKSEFVDELVLRLCLLHDWKVGFFSPENMPVVYHYTKLAEKLLGCKFERSKAVGKAQFKQVTNFLQNNISHICPKGEASPKVIFNKCRDLALRKGCRIFVLDPLNRFDHTMKPGQTETQYLSSFLNEITRFALEYHCLVILVAHPRKMNREITGKRPRPEMYDISGTADFFNKADFGFVVDRRDEEGIVKVYVDKVKFKHLGHTGEAVFTYNVTNGRYSSFGGVEMLCESMLTTSDKRVKQPKDELGAGSWLNTQESEAAQGELQMQTDAPYPDMKARADGDENENEVEGDSEAEDDENPETGKV